MKRILGPVALLLACVVSLSAGDADGKRWWSYVEALANDGMQGRQTGSPEHRKAAEYVASQFQQAGLFPAGVKDTCSRSSSPPAGLSSRKAASSWFAMRRRTGSLLGDDATISLRNNPADAVEAPLVFAGYGLSVPEMKFDDFAGLDLKGKIAVTLAGGPSSVPGNLRAHYGYASERGKCLEQAGAIGLVTIQNPSSADVPWARSSLARLQESMSLTDQALVDMKNRDHCRRQRGACRQVAGGLWTLETNRYHAPSDDLSQPVDLPAAAAYNHFMMTLATTVANNTARPKWKPESFFKRFTS